METCAIGTLASGASKTVTITTALPTSVPPDAKNKLTVTGKNASGVTVSASKTVSLIPKAKTAPLKLSRPSVSSPTLAAGGEATIHETVSNPNDHAVADAYGVWVEKSRYGRTYMGIQRSTFIIDADGTVAKAMANVQPATHADDVLGSLRELAGAGSV